MILLIAGLATQMVRWTAPFCEQLASRGYRVIRFDNRDAGCSTHFSHWTAPDLGALEASLVDVRALEVPYALEDMAEDAIGLLEALSIQRAHVVGRSMGGMIAQIMAADHAERVASLTSIMSSTGNPALPQAAPDLMAMMARPGADPGGDVHAFVAHSLAFARRIAGSSYPVDEAAHGCLIMDEIGRGYASGAVGRQVAAIAKTGDLRARLSSVTAPTLVIHGADDPLVPPAAGEDTAAAIPNSEFMLVEGMGHDIPADLFGRIAAAIDANARRRL